MNQIEASNQWNYYQAKSIKASVLDAEMSLADTPGESDQSKRDRYEKEQEEIKSDAEHKEAAAKSNFHKHEVFARGRKISLRLGRLGSIAPTLGNVSVPIHNPMYG